MSRTDTYVGLNKRASLMLLQAESSFSGEEIEGAFFNTFPLRKYVMPDGRVFFERVQDAPWSSGPNFFTALQTQDNQWVEESLWSEQEIDEQMGYDKIPYSA